MQIELKIEGGDLVVTLLVDGEEGRSWQESEARVSLARLALALARVPPHAFTVSEAAELTRGQHWQAE